MKTHLRILLTAALLAGGAICPARAQEQPGTALRSALPSITIKSKTSDLVAPDFVDFTLAVVTEKPTPTAAAAANSDTMRALLVTLKELGIESADISTASFQVTQLFKEEPAAGGQNSRRVPHGYSASNTLTIHLKDMNKMGRLAGAMIEKGVNKFESIEFGIKDRAQREDDLRIRAMKQAAARAQSYADALGMRLGRVLEISPETIEEQAPSGRYFYRPRSYRKSEDDTRDPLVIPLEPAPVSIAADVTVVWEIVK